MAFPQAASQLDGPPPSPQMAGAGPMGAPSPFSLSAMAPGLPSHQMPPEILTGILQSSQKIGELLDSYAQVAPDLAMQFSAIKDQLAQVLAQLVQSGAGAMSSTAVGRQFPAAFDRGVAGAGTV